VPLLYRGGHIVWHDGHSVLLADVPPVVLPRFSFFPQYYRHPAPCLFLYCSGVVDVTGRGLEHLRVFLAWKVVYAARSDGGEMLEWQ